MTFTPQRLESASMAAWPGLAQKPVGQWLARHGLGHTRRCNSISVLARDADPERTLADGEAWLAGHGVPPIVRVLDYAGADPWLFDSAGYGSPFDRTITLTCELAPFTAVPAGVSIETRLTDAWLAAKDRLNGDSASDGAARRAILPRIPLPVGYGALAGPDGEAAAVAYMALDGELASLNMVVTDPALRGRRYSERVCAGLMAWARANGATHACLQMQADNDPAFALYSRLGYEGPIYAYAYRAKEAA